MKKKHELDVYAYIELSRCDFGAFRLLGPGLGNLLFPWARAVVASQEHSIKLIWPTWPQLKVGPIIRLESDLRFYFDLFMNPGNYLGGSRKLWLLATARRFSETDLNAQTTIAHGWRSGLICFNGMHGMFEPIRSHRELVRNRLLLIARREHKKGMNHDFRHSITVHVRMGDFEPFDEQRLRAGKFNIRLPMSWLVETIQILREDLGVNWPVWLFSDGSDNDLIDILRLDNVRRLHFGSALADMLAMSCSNVLVVSSIFSMWSAFLGAVPSIYYPGQLRQYLLTQQSNKEIEREPGAHFGKCFLNNIYKDFGMN